ncbi:diacylglycerol kinase family protein [Mycoplasmatota bacterium WC30]
MFLIIHNPLSNNRKSKKTTNKMVKFFKRNSIPFMLRSTLKIENLNDFLDKSPRFTDIVYLGGDGSLNYLINNVDVSKIKQNIYLAKSGSGNDFLRSLKRIKKGSVTIGEAVTDNKTVKFINGAGIGIDSLVCHYVNSDANKSKLSYFIHFFRAIIKFKRTDFEVVVDGKNYAFEKAYFVTIQNGKYFGGGMKAASTADITNDNFIVLVAHNLNNFLIQLIFVTIYLGWHKYFKRRATFITGKKIEIKVPTALYFQTDGEAIENVTNVNIKKVASREFIAFNKKDFKNIIAKKYHSN